MIKALTLNSWGTYGPFARRRILLDSIRSINPEILCLQEVTDASLLTELAYPTRFHAPESGLAILSRFPATANRTITYQATSLLEPYRRQALLVELQLESGPIWIATTHLAWMAEDTPTRLAQAEELVSTLTPLGNRLLLTGDFNAEPHHPPIQRILESGFLDLYALAHPTEPGVTWDNRNPLIQSHSIRFPDRRIDYLFLRKEALSFLQPIGCEVVCNLPSVDGLFPSDHYGVLATLK